MLYIGMEIYSTTLWHLQKEVALSALAQDLTEMSRTSPQVSILDSKMYANIVQYCNKMN